MSGIGDMSVSERNLYQRKGCIRDRIDPYFESRPCQIGIRIKKIFMALYWREASIKYPKWEQVFCSLVPGLLPW